MSKYPFVVRVYGIFIHPEKGLLVSDEFVFNQQVTKFPGGGLEFGEGTIDCLVREMKEETGFEFEVTGHYYTTDFFVASAFNTELQVLSIYYRMKPVGDIMLPVAELPFSFPEQVEGAQSLRYIPMSEVGAAQFTLEIDRHVGELLKVNP
jgi:8-oxo-dGTP pyrophosphatase MutT (NUDIX family)